MRKASRKPGYQQRIARERIKRLFESASMVFKSDHARAHRYVRLARKIAMRYNIRLPKGLKRRVCKKCHRYLMPGVNSSVRTNSKQKAVIVKCLECGNVMRYPYGVKKKN